MIALLKANLIINKKYFLIIAGVWLVVLAIITGASIYDDLTMNEKGVMAILLISTLLPMFSTLFVDMVKKESLEMENKLFVSLGKSRKMISMSRYLASFVEIFFQLICGNVFLLLIKLISFRESIPYSLIPVVSIFVVLGSVMITLILRMVDGVRPPYRRLTLTVLYMAMILLPNLLPSSVKDSIGKFIAKIMSMASSTQGILIVLIAFAALGISYFISVVIYNKRDFT